MDETRTCKHCHTEIAIWRPAGLNDPDIQMAPSCVPESYVFGCGSTEYDDDQWEDQQADRCRVREVERELAECKKHSLEDEGYVEECLLESRTDQDGSMFRVANNGSPIVAYLRGYAIVPKEKYLALIGKKE